jgi:hypothetical protein
VSILDTLEKNRGDVRAILKIPDGGGYFDLSDPAWSKTSVVLSELNFKRIKLYRTEVKANIVSSVFSDCLFDELLSVGHFWSADNKWKDCVYTRCHFEDAICPQNYFERCTFTDLHLIGSTIYETVFRECTFVDAHFEGVAVERSRNTRKPYAELELFDSCVVFERCRFERPEFSKCRFHDVAFIDCEIVDPVNNNSDFSGVKGFPIWWDDAVGIDPFVAFLEEVLTMIEKKLGKESRAYLRMLDYQQRYLLGATKSKDYSLCLYEGDVPDSELKKIENWLEKIERRYGW